MDELTQRYCSGLTLGNPKSVLIQRWAPPERSEGGIIIPMPVRDNITRSGFWAKLLKISQTPTTEEYINILRDFYSDKINHFVLFQPMNPILGGLSQTDEQQRIQLMAITEILTVVPPSLFYDTVVASYTGEDEARALFLKDYDNAEYNFEPTSVEPI